MITVFILWSGLTALRENMDLLMGTADRQLTEQICSIILGYDIFGRVISCAVHDYGPSAKTAVICVALNPHCSRDAKSVSAAISEASECLRSRLGLSCVIYCDPREV